MNIMQAIKTAISSYRHETALADADIQFDDVTEAPERTDAEYWLSVCLSRRTTGTPLVRDPLSRRLLEEAANDTFHTGFCGRLWVFPDGSRIVANDALEMVQ